MKDLFGVEQEEYKKEKVRVSKRVNVDTRKRTESNGCEKCSRQGKDQIFGEGSLDAEIVVIGSAPVQEFDREGRLLVSAGSRYLRFILQQLGILDEVYITNVVKCYAYRNVEPVATDVKCCKFYLEEELMKLNKRKIIIALGDVVMEWFGLGKVEENRGFIRQTKWGPVMGTYNPVLLQTMERNGITGQESLELLVQDFKRAIDFVKNGLVVKDITKCLDYCCLMTNDDLRKFVVCLKPGMDFALDFETSSLNIFDNDFRVLSCAVAFDNSVWVFPFEDERCSIDKDLLKQILCWMYNNGNMIVYNAMFDVIVGNRFLGWGIRMVDDVMLMWYLLNGGNRRFVSLKRLALDFTDWGQYGVSLEQMKDMSSMDKDSLYVYNAIDARVTLELWQKMIQWMMKADIPWSNIFGKNPYSIYDVWVNVVKKALYVLLEMKWNGVKVDVDYLLQLEVQLGKHISELEQEIYKIANTEFDIDSPVQVKKVLADKGLVLENTDKRVLEQYRDKVLLVDMILRYRELSKLYNTYVVALLTEHLKSDGCVHADYNLNGTVTGRVSSSNPNLQNIPTKMGGIIEKAFKSRFDDGLIMKVDFSQHELRVVAAYSGDEEMVNVFLQGKDLHDEVVKNIYGLSEEDRGTEKWKELRRYAKGFNFGILYGRGARSLSLELGISEDEAVDKIQEYFKFFPKLRSWINQVQAFAKEYGLVRTMWGRVRYLEKDEGKMYREAVNTPVQSAASDIALLVAYDILNEIKARSLRTLCVNFIHDAILLDVPGDEVEQVIGIIKDKVKAMELPVNGLCPPLDVDISIGKTWGDCS